MKRVVSVRDSADASATGVVERSCRHVQPTRASRRHRVRPPTRTAGCSGSYVVDRRDAERHLVASALRPAPHRHEIDDLVSASCAAAFDSALLVLCNPFPADGLPDEVYATLVADVRAAGIPVIVDLSRPRPRSRAALPP